MFNKDYIVMLVRTAFQFISLAATLKPNLFQGIDLIGLESQTIAIIGGVGFIVSTGQMLWARLHTEVVSTK